MSVLTKQKGTDVWKCTTNFFSINFKVSENEMDLNYKPAYKLEGEMTSPDTALTGVDTYVTVKVKNIGNADFSDGIMIYSDYTNNFNAASISANIGVNVPIGVEKQFQSKHNNDRPGMYYMWLCTPDKTILAMDSVYFSESVWAELTMEGSGKAKDEHTLILKFENLQDFILNTSCKIFINTVNERPQEPAFSPSLKIPKNGVLEERFKFTPETAATYYFWVENYYIDVLEANFEIGNPTSVLSQNTNKKDLIIYSEYSRLYIQSEVAQPVVVYDMKGVIVAKFDIASGETKQLQLPAGLYIINGKVIQVD